MFRRLLLALSKLLVVFLIYVGTTAVALFYFRKPEMEKESGEKRMEPFTNDGLSEDRVVLVQDRFESGLARVNLVENAEKRLDISYYAIEDGISSEIFLGSIIDAANRGVKIRMMVDGVMNIFNRKIHEVGLVFAEHPNIEFKYYNRLKPLKPWTWHHRLHDKIILVDERFAMVGGRNIGDRYFSPDVSQRVTNDRDVLVINTNEETMETSVIQEIKAYYEKTWNHKFAEIPHGTLSARQHRQAKETKADLRLLFEEVHDTHPEFFHLELDWLDYSFPVHHITFLHNPLEPLNSEPLIWKELARRMEQAESSIYIETPYVIPTKNMRGYVNEDKITASTIEIHTNSLASSPNLIAYSGYTNYRKELVHSGIELYEFQSETESHHAKAFVFDQRISAIGSFNLDPRSAFLNTEVMLVIDSEEFAEHMADLTDSMKKNSLQVGRGGEYIDSDHMAKVEVSGLKRFLNWGLSKVTRVIEFLL